MLPSNPLPRGAAVTQSSDHRRRAGTPHTTGPAQQQDQQQKQQTLHQQQRQQQQTDRHHESLDSHHDLESTSSESTPGQERTTARIAAHGGEAVKADAMRSSNTGESSHRRTLVAPQLQDHLIQAAHYAKELNDRNEELEAENKRLKDLVRQHQTSALDWCSTAKTYEQDRNFIAYRLAELEMQIAQKALLQDVSSKKGAAAPVSTIAVSKAPVAKDTEENVFATTSFVSQSISQILDYMTPSKSTREPRLPPLSKGSYLVDNNADAAAHRGTGQVGESTLSTVATSTGAMLPLRPALKSSSFKTSICACGCQEEIKAWKARCEYAENRATLTELRHERSNIVMEGYKAKWTQWRERTIRHQYQRRMRNHMSPQAIRYMSLDMSTASDDRPPQQQQGLQQRNRGPRQSALPSSLFPTRADAKRARFNTEESDTSQQRRETTERNTLFNQFTDVLRGTTSTSTLLRTGMGSIEEPHVIFDDNEDNPSSNEDPGSTSGRSRSPMYVADSEGNDTSIDYGERPLSLTFPSDLALLRRHQYHIELEEDDEKDEHQDGQSSFDSSSKNRAAKTGSYTSVSPTARASHTREQKRNVSYQQDESTAQQRSLSGSSHVYAKGISNIESDRSSPPMFDTDFLTAAAPQETHAEQTSMETMTTTTTTADHSRTPQKATAGHVTDNEMFAHHTSALYTPKANTYGPKGKSVVRAAPSSSGISPDQRKFYVPETPLELQGITQTVSGTAAAASTVHRVQRQTAAAASDTVDLDAGIHTEALSHVAGRHIVDRPDKENEEPASGDTSIEQEYSEGEALQHHHQQQLPLGHHQSSNTGPSERIFNFTERRKDKRKQMHGHDCSCCRRFFELTGPLPLPDGYNAFFTPAPRPGEKEVWEKTAEERLQDRVQQISRHRVQHEPPMTPPGFWDTDFPPTQERLEWDRIAKERRDRKKQRTEHTPRQQQQQQRN